MALIEDSKTPARRPQRLGPDKATARPVSVAEVLGQAGIDRARTVAQADRQRLRERTLLPSVPHPADHVDPDQFAPDPRLIDRFGQALCLRHRILPLRQIPGATLILAEDRAGFLRLHDALSALFGPVRLVLTDPDRMDAALARACPDALHRLSENRTPLAESCRGWNGARTRNLGLAALALVLAVGLLWPVATFTLLCGWAVLAMVLSLALKVMAARLALRAPDAPPSHARSDPGALPVVTLLVPLFRERDIARDLIRRLERLDYPRDRLDFCLVVEDGDMTTRAALAQATLPPTMRAIAVPPGNLQTKPRAMNYALAFARGQIIGVYDAEDAPAPDQLRKVAAQFASAGPDVACLQGRLDFYNAQTNWLSRCFAIEYAVWFRLVLPGMERLGLPLPLGGTTLFLRRDVLEDLGGWDAHNVTEDADLGIRLARHGYRTEILDSVTEEEANARVWPWVRQRSRWLKGYAVTYAVHMRRPAQLWRDLGPAGFFGVQVLFLGTLSQFVLAPVLWSLWLVALGLPHPLSGALGTGGALALALLFLGAEIVGIALACLAVRLVDKRALMIWTPTLHLYFPLAALAAYRGLIELASRPFYWDKTAHGIFAPTPTRRNRRPVSASLPPLRHPDAAE